MLNPNREAYVKKQFQILGKVDPALFMRVPEVGSKCVANYMQDNAVRR